MTKLIILLFCCVPVFSQTGSADLNVTDANGRKQGKWIKYYPDSEVRRYEGQFEDDKPKGVFIYYNFPGGEVKSILSYSSENRASVKSYYPNGTIMATGVYEAELKDSTWTYFSMYGEKIAVDYYIHGKRYGNCVKYHSNGQLLEERYFENEIENGPYVEYYENGIISRKGTYVNGSLEGEGVFYHPNGQVYFVGNYYRDTKHGIWKTYNDKGELIDERQYTKGVAMIRDSDLIMEDTAKYYRKDTVDIKEFIPDDYMAIPPDKSNSVKEK